MVDGITLKSKLAGLKLLVIGDLMLDEYMWGSCERISPEAPVPVVDVKRQEATLGGAGNVLKNLSSFGVQAGILSVTGDDLTASEICKQLALLGLDTSGIYKDPARISSQKTRVLAANHQMIRIDRETKKFISGQSEDFILNYLKNNIGKYDLLLVSDYLKGVLSERVLKLISELCNHHNKKVIVDPKGNDYTKYSGVSIIKPNRKELQQATGIEVTDKTSLSTAAKKLKQAINCDTVIVTLSEEGIAIYENDLEIIPTKATAIFDVTGAGDTVLASLGICIAAGVDLRDACTFANHAAAIVVSKVGSATTTIDEVLNHIENDK